MFKTIVKYDISKHVYVRFMGHVEYNKSWKHFSRIQHEYILYVVASGEMFIDENDIEYHLKPNDAFLLEPGFEHHGYKKSQCHYYYIHFTTDAFSIKEHDISDISTKMFDIRNQNIMSSHYDVHEHDHAPIYFPKHFSFSYPWEVFDLLKQMDHVFFEKLEGRRRIASIKLEELLIRLSRNFCDSFTDNKKPKSFLVIRNIQAYIHENYFKPIESSDIEALFEMNYDYLNRNFKLTTGYTIRNYVNLQKISHAKYLLENENCKIGEIGYIVGINDPYYFSKVFKKHTGYSPSEYMKYIKESH